MKITITDLQREYLAGMKCGLESLREVELDSMYLLGVQNEVKRHHPEYSDVQVMAHAVARACYWKYRAQVAKPMPTLETNQEPALIAVSEQPPVDYRPYLKAILVLLVLLLLVNVAKAQGGSKIYTITFQNSSGSNLGMVASPFSLRAGSNCSFSKDPSSPIWTLNCTGGAAAAGGSSGQLQWNQASGLAGVSTVTTDGTAVTVGNGGSVTYSGTGTVNASHYQGNSSPTATEFSYLAGVTSAIQTQLTSKLNSTDLTDSLIAGKFSGTGKCYLYKGAAGTNGCDVPSGTGNTTSTSLTSGTVPKANGENSIVNSSITDDGSTVTVNGDFVVTGAVSAGGNGPMNLSSISDPAIPAAGDIWRNTTLLKYYDGTSTGTLLTDNSTLAIAKLDTDVATQAELNAHTGNTSNPHNVTAVQVGLGNVNNTSDADKPISTATQSALNGKAASDASTTVNGQTCALGGTCTVADATKIPTSEKAAANGVASLDGTTKVPIAQLPTGTSSSTVATGDHAHAGVYEPSNSNIQAHISSTSNPHSVTAAQAGALADPGSGTSILKRTGANAVGAAVASDVTSLFSGTGDYLKSDGTKGTPTAATSPFGVHIGYEGIPGASQVLTRVTVPGGITWSVGTNCAGSGFTSRLESEVAATGSVTISLQKCTGTGFTSCSQFGTAVFSASGKTAAFTCTATTFTGGTDSFLAVAPSSGDTTLSKLAGEVMGTR